MRRLALLLSAVCSFGCAPSEVEVSRAPIINGMRETGYPEVVAVYWMSGASAGGLCSGTVIGPYAILTAKHCVFEETATGYRAVAPSEFFVLVGDDLNSPGGVSEVHYVAEVRTTPGSDVNADVENGYDIAVLLLRDRITVTPREVATSGPVRGEAATIVGFGRTSTVDPDSAGVKYRGETRIDMVGTRQLSALGSSGTCQGDSGGPIFDPAGRVTGITSYGFGRCETRFPSVFVRTAAFRSLITDALAFVPPCEPTGETCNGIDDDCDGTIDDGLGCAPIGSPCTDSSECLRSTCEDLGDGTRICTGTCFIDAPRDCPAGLYCRVNGCGSGLCAPGAPGAGATGAPCTSDGECASGYCAPLRSGSVCAAPCCPDGGIFCGDPTLVCDLVPGGDGRGACVPPELASGPRAFGSPCMADDECLSGRCADPGEYCTEVCDASTPCPLGYRCSSRDGAGTCLLGELAPTGGPCSTPDDCRDASAACVEGVCAGACDGSEGSCPDGFACTASSAGDVCLRPGAGLGDACMTNEECRSGICTPLGCTIICDALTCPEGFACQPAGAASACLRPQTSGGCSALRRGSAHGGSLAALGLVAAALGLLVGRRRADRR
jgi:hypothetical protein